MAYFLVGGNNNGINIHIGNIIYGKMAIANMFFNCHIFAIATVILSNL